MEDQRPMIPMVETSNNSAFAPVSAIIPCYNCSSTIERAASSVVNQTLPPKEVILVNDGSSDDTLSTLLSLQEKYGTERVQVIDLKKNRGPGYARNVGWDSATQPYVAFLDADDAWHPQKIEIQYNWMKAHPEAAMTGHDCVWIQNPADEALYATLPPAFEVQRVGRSLLWSNVLSTRSVMLIRDLPFRFRKEKRFSEDYLLWLEIVLNGFPAFKIRLPLAFLYKAPYGAAGLSGKLWEMEKGELATYWSLYREGLLSFWSAVFFSNFSIVKFVRRVALSKMILTAKKA